MPAQWPIISAAFKDGRHELVLSGAEISKLLDEVGLDNRIYELKSLNFLEISHTNLAFLSEHISNLSNLTQLGLTKNCLQAIPPTLRELKLLKFLDLSFNQLKELPSDMFINMVNLCSLNLSGNELDCIPSVRGLTMLHDFIACKNKLKVLPEGFDCLQALSLLDVGSNNISEIPYTVSNLCSLKHADFSENSLVTVPTSLHQCRKLTVLNLRGNPLTDKRLRKLVMDDHSSTALLTYIRKLDESAVKANKTHNKNKGAYDSVEVPVDLSNSLNNKLDLDSFPYPRIIIQRPSDAENYYVNQMQSVKTGPRPYLIVCTVHGVDLTSESKVRAFTSIQNEWHRNIGQMRRRATLATHDLSKIKFPLTYTLRDAGAFEVHVLNRSSSCTGATFLKQLLQEAEADRKLRKQAKFSQLYRYLTILNMDGQEWKSDLSGFKLPVVIDNTQTVISVPPLTNCHQTRLTTSTNEILVEVSGTTLTICQQFAELVISWLLDHACQSPSVDGPSVSNLPTDKNRELSKGLTENLSIVHKPVTVPPGSLVVRPIRVLDFEAGSTLCTLFPSRLDLTDSKFNTVRS